MAPLRAPTALDLATFSVCLRGTCGGYGVAVATARPNVGALVPYVSLQGAVATQARVDTTLGERTLALVGRGMPVATAIDALLSVDDARPVRQLHGVDATGAHAATGADCVPWAGSRAGDGVSVAGNMLAGPEVVDAMLEAAEADRDREIGERLLRVLEAGQAAGGDKRGKQSAALLAASPEPRLHHNLRVDDHADPVAELRRLKGVMDAQTDAIRRDYGEEGVRLFSRVRR
ncbi:MAG: DUF1028 domain-containing protein [Trueperaceae bacterium]|nr:DUF1028 domain-containing protein [Trueperaceae bacterium]